LIRSSRAIEQTFPEMNPQEVKAIFQFLGFRTDDARLVIEIFKRPAERGFAFSIMFELLLTNRWIKRLSPIKKPRNG